MVNLTKSMALLALLVTGGTALADSPLHDVLERTRAEKVKIFTDREFGRRACWPSVRPKATSGPAPPPNAARVNYHIRPGQHDLLLSDWNAYLDHAAAHGW